MSGVHRLQHVECLATPDLTDHEPVGSHPECVAEEVSDGHLAPALDVGGAGLEADHVRLAET